MNLLSNSSTNPWSKLLILLGFLCIGAFIGQVLIILFFNPPTSVIHSFTTDPLAYKNHLLTIQAILASSVFIVAPLLYELLIEKKPLQVFFIGSQPYSYVYAIMLTIGLVGSFMVVNTLFIYWNMQVKLPAFLQGFEQWAQAKEAELKNITTLLTTYSSTRELWPSLFVMAILPAIGEELLFRGLLQRLLHTITQNIHFAILISAFIFSAIHLQFYGFLPRLLLGVLFGYVYWWTQDLSLAILAHFFNNAFTLILLFLQQKAWIAYEIDSPQLPPLWILAFFSLSTVIFAISLQRLGKRSHP